MSKSIPETCIVDGSKNIDLVKTYSAATALYRCRDCGLKFIYPPQASEHEFYESNLKEGDYYYRWEFDEAHAVLFARSRAERQSTLDVGCGPGLFVETLKREGHDAWGIDFSATMVERANKRGLDQVQRLTLDEFAARYPGKKFDVITCFHVLEHVDDPKAFVSGLRAMLKEGGTLFIAVPHQNRFMHRLIKKKMGDDFPMHVTFWTPEALSRLMQAGRFDVKRVSFSPPASINAVFHYNFDVIFSGFKHFLKLEKIMGKNIVIALARTASAVLSPVSGAIFNIFRIEGPSLICVSTKSGA
jgi:SAM-dependent methyltransferase